MQGEAPWYGVPIIAGLFLIVGGLLSFAYAYSNENRKHERDLQRQWLFVLHEECSRLMEIVYKIQRQASTRDNAEVGQLIRESFRVSIKLILIAPYGVRRKLSDLQRLLRQLEREVGQRLAPEQLAGTTSKIADALDQLTEEMRRALRALQ